MKYSGLQIKSEILDDFLVKIRNSSKNPEIHANPFFYLVKPTEENLKKYALKRPESLLLYLLEISLFLPFIMFHFIATIFYSILFSKRSSPGEISNTQNCKYLFVSHFTYAQSPTREDLFFGKNLSIGNSLSFYLNHTKTPSSLIQKAFQESGKEDVQINAKTLKPLQMMTLQFQQLKISCLLLRNSIFSSELMVSQKRLLIKAAVFQHSRPTMANLVFIRHFSKVIARVNPRFVILTIEGHAHEALLLQMRNSIPVDFCIVGYQHSPLVAGQKNFFRIISLFQPRDVLLTSGQITQQLVKNKNLVCRVENLGSPKSREFKSQSKSKSRIRVLLAPEGTIDSLSDFISISNQLAPKLPAIHFALRTHPALGERAKKLIKRELSLIENLTQSTNSLHEDLESSHIVIFRSSAVGIEGLAWNALPIHFNHLKGNFLNPLEGSNLEGTSTVNIEELLDVIKKYDPNLYQTEAIEMRNYELFLNYYGPLLDITRLIY